MLKTPTMTATEMSVNLQMLKQKNLIRKVSNIIRTKYQNVNASRLIL